eukprot:TRINITY_DN13961_c0_g1_i1.p1 TRINITY_DN13961_c0_g1~~TRINITY_DN13961_c0_g1_i1.p1  ORF type:complete len:405 (-),score=67.47 TRINITY_DN13961_c0_g1_i1:164-1378(-)
MVLALYELPLGVALLNVAGPQNITLQKLLRFKDNAQAVEFTKDLLEHKCPKTLQKFLKNNVDAGTTLAVQDAKIGAAIQKKCSITCEAADNDNTFRAIREKISELLQGFTPTMLQQFSLGLSHTLNRHTLKFSADKVDVMVIQAIALLDDIDKELNTYAMRVKEWYGWHFPELQKHLSDNLQYARLVLLMGYRQNAVNVNLSDVIEEGKVEDVKLAALHSMGVGLTESDLEHIKLLCNEVVTTSEYRSQLYEYLKARMKAIAPNLTTMVGEMLGARLISHAGSLTNLAKAPASTVQLLGAEKALFKALKAKQNTPKYGLLYHCSFVGQASGAKSKGTLARVVGNKTALSARVDALTEGRIETATVGVTGREKAELRLRQIEAGTSFKAVKGDYKQPAAKRMKFD